VSPCWSLKNAAKFAEIVLLPTPPLRLVTSILSAAGRVATAPIGGSDDFGISIIGGGDWLFHEHTTPIWLGGHPRARPLSLVGKREPHLFEGRGLDLANALGTDTKFVCQVMQGHTAGAVVINL
jgi:hypothetical protein